MICEFLISLGFSERVKGSHDKFTVQDVPKILNLQPKDSFAKLYQVKQVRRLIYSTYTGRFEAVIAEWLDAARDLGRPIPDLKGRLLYA